MLALAIPVLPFALSYALYSPHPELFGMSALLAYILGLTRCQTLRATAYLSATYGSVTAVLALLHEAIPLQMALGAVLAIVGQVQGRGVRRRRVILRCRDLCG